MAKKYPAIFKSAVQNLKVHIESETSSLDEREQMFVHFGDMNKSQEKQVCKLAKEYGMKIDVADKGLIFS